MIRLSVTGVVLFGLAACLPGSRIGAFEATDGATVEKAPLRTFTTPRAALQAGLERFRSGDTASAIEALKYAASGGEALAQWKFAKIYANGEGVPRDNLKAIFLKSSLITMRTTRTGATSRSCRAPLSRLEFII
jgi:TPR repeat protein